MVLLRDPELVKDFLAFGFAFLQVELLTQQMRYASSIDQTRIARWGALPRCLH